MAPIHRSLSASLLGILILLANGCAPATSSSPTSSDHHPEPSVSAGTPTATAAPQSAAASSWPRVPRQIEIPLDRPLKAAFLLVDGVYNTELTAPWDVLDHVASYVEGVPPLEIFAVSADGQPITTAEGLQIGVNHSFDNAPEFDILVVPSAVGSPSSDLKDQRMIAWVAERGGRASYVMSLCWGAFVLAEAGLLDGTAMTTFPKDYDRFSDRFPAVDLHRGPSFVHDGRALTSQGGVRSFDVAMYLVDHLYGEPVAQGIGAGLLIDWPPVAQAPPTALILDH